MATESVIFAVVTALVTLASAFIAFFSNRKQAAEQASDRLIDQMQEQIADMRQQIDADRARYIAEIERLRQEIDVERQARIGTEQAAAQQRETYERQISSLRAQLDEATIARNDRMERIKELETELNALRGQVAKLEKRDTGDLSK